MLRKEVPSWKFPLSQIPIVYVLTVVGCNPSGSLPKHDAVHHVAGYVLHNDYSERAFQLERGGQWVKGKSPDTFAPWAHSSPLRNNLKMWLRVNGETRQNSSTPNMIFDVANSCPM